MGLRCHVSSIDLRRSIAGVVDCHVLLALGGWITPNRIEIDIPCRRIGLNNLLIRKTRYIVSNATIFSVNPGGGSYGSTREEKVPQGEDESEIITRGFCSETVTYKEGRMRSSNSDHGRLATYA